MSTTRISPKHGWVEANELPRRPNGRALCRNCGTEVPRGRRTFCSEGCVDDWASRYSPTLMRQRVFRRDGGICALCGVDTTKLGMAFTAEWRRVKRARTEQERRDRAEFRQRYRWFFRRRTYWDADHIVPVVEGGGECTMTNIRTLCVPCHQRVTKEQSRNRASQRRWERVGRQDVWR
jgi:5-methylcytosine-specific restriction enzyme A